MIIKFGTWNFAAKSDKSYHVRAEYWHQNLRLNSKPYLRQMPGPKLNQDPIIESQAKLAPE